MKKKWISLFCTMTILFCALMFSAENIKAEASGSGLDGHVVLSTNATSLNEGGTVEVNLYVKDLEIAYIDMYIEYDTEIFNELDEEDFILNRNAVGNSWGLVFAQKPHKLSISDYGGQITSIGDNGLLATIRFTVKNTASSATIKFTNIDAVIDVNGKFKDYEDEAGISLDINNLNYDKNSNKFALSSDSVQGTAGSDVSIPLNIAENTGINALGLTIKYDESICSYNDLTITGTFKDKIALQSIYAVPGEGEIRASFISKDDITDIGNFANVSFTIKEGVSAGTTSNVTIEIEQVTNKEETEVTGSGASATITVMSQSEEPPEEPSHTLGDVNGDGKIDLTDAVYILLAYNGEKTLTTLQQTAADVNGDNTVNLADALQIMKYLL